MAYHVNFAEPTYDSRCDQWVLSGSLRLKISGEEYRTLSSKQWITHEARFTERWFKSAKEDIRRQLIDRANRETRAALQYRQPVEVASFERISIPLARRIYPQLIANTLVGVQPMRGPSPLMDLYLNYRHAGETCKDPYKKVNWKEEGF